MKNNLAASTLQRLGHILDRILDNPAPASEIEKKIKNRVLHRVPIDSSLGKTGKKTDPKWRVILNAGLETERLRVRSLKTT